jgi:hypothetical protein
VILLARLHRLLVRAAERRWVGFGVGLVLALAATSPILDARWGPIDDHEIVGYLGPDHRLSLGEIPAKIAETEAVHPGGSPRYRPSYYVLRIGETALWGGRPGVWYAARVGMLALFLAAIVWVLRSGASVLELLALAGLVGSYGWWADIFLRMGPAEAYGTLGVGLFALGAAAALRSPRGVLPGLLLFIGGAIAIGSKENFLILLFPSLWVAWRSRRRPWLLVASLATAGYAVFIGVATFLGVTRHGHVYAEDVSGKGRIAVLVDALRGAFVEWGKLWLWGALAWAVIYVTLTLLRRTGAARALLREGWRAVVAIALLVGLHVSQVVFYNGHWPPGVARYYFPGALVAPLLLFVGYRLAVRALQLVRLPAPLVALVRLAAVGLLIWSLPPRFAALRAAAAKSVRFTGAFTAKVDEIAAAHRRHPDWPIVFESREVWDFEFLHSVQQFLRYANVEAPVYLTLVGYGPDTFGQGTLERQLSEWMTHNARDGAPPPSLLRPFADFRGPPCYALGFSGEPSSSGCESLGVVPKP